MCGQGGAGSEEEAVFATHVRANSLVGETNASARTSISGVAAYNANMNALASLTNSQPPRKPAWSIISARSRLC